MPSIRVFLVLLLLASTASAATFLVGTDRDMTLTSDAIVVGVVDGTGSQWRSGQPICTVTAVRVDEVIRGPIQNGNVITIAELGGVSDGIALVIPGSARFTPGERVLLFLTRDERGRWRAKNMTLGKFRFTGELLVRDDAEGWNYDGRPHREPLRNAENFLRFVRETARGGNPVPQYLAPAGLGQNANALIPHNNATIGSYLIQTDGGAGTLGIRWNTFPSQIVFLSNGSQPGAQNGGITGVQRGLAAWTNDGSSNILYQYGGTTTRNSAFRSNDGVNSVQFNDPSSEIPGSFTGTGGDTLAIGGAWFGTSAGSSHAFGGENFYTIVEADLIFQDGLTQPGVGGNGFDHVASHELGHTLGFRHSDEPPSGGTSSSTALMNSSVDFESDPTGAAVQAWDREAAAAVYGSGGGTTPPPPPVCTPPSITTQPASANFVTTPITLTVGATGTAISYQWYTGSRGDTRAPISSATSPSITVSPSTTTSYWVRVTGQCSPAADSLTAIVTVAGCPGIAVTSRTEDQSILEGASVGLSVSISAGGRPVTFEWFVGEVGNTSTPLSTQQSLTVTPAVTTKYWVQMKNDCGVIASSETITITVRPCTVPRVVIQPSNIDVVSGGSGTLAATISGTLPLTFQWFEGARLDMSRPVLKATTASFTTDPLFGATSYWLRVRNECGQVDTEAAQVSVVQSCSTPTIMAQPKSQTVSPGTSTILSVSAAGPSLQYRWYQGPVFDFTHPVGGSAPSLATPPINQETQFWVQISNPCGSVNSVTVTLTPGASRRRAAG